LSNLASLLRQGEFVVTAELNPPKSASGEVVKRRAGLLKGSVDAVNVTDSNRSIAAMAAIPAAHDAGRGVLRRIELRRDEELARSEKAR